ncbi:hypothetical protein AZE42_12757 [Rhizopogon vesiculosus]|uniref:Uncharacterized protein n=1 Tax=Rhizopogon vesiculosus TaxID=180088 RepID=A0A1J8R1G4_9AGAM|nr:hypothetical protein AZE42_12757 [Rhizopogon vesiculosus]
MFQGSVISIRESVKLGARLTHSLKVTCVLFDALEEIKIITCPCFPTPLQLLH